MQFVLCNHPGKGSSEKAVEMSVTNNSSFQITTLTWMITQYKLYISYLTQALSLYTVADSEQPDRVQFS